MKKIKYCLSFFLCIVILNLFLHIQGYSQIPWNENSRHRDKWQADSEYFLNKTYILATEHPDTVRLFIYSKIAYDLLQFISSDSIYTANFEITIQIKKGKYEAIAGVIEKGKVVTHLFEETNNRHKYTQRAFVFSLKPGNYNLYIELLDYETKKSFIRKKSLIIPEIQSDSLILSDILYIRSEKKDRFLLKKHFPLFPPVRPVVDSTFSALFYVLAKGETPVLRLSYSIQSHDKHKVYADSFQIGVTAGIHQIIIPINQKLEFGKYTLNLHVQSDAAEQRINSPFYVQWDVHPTSIKNLDEALAPLQLIMDSSDWKHLQSLSSIGQKEKIASFWAKRDPDPETKENELEKEFYRRVSFTNQYFTQWKDGGGGWRTDRGRVYIEYGQPSEIERPSILTGEQGKYEIWYYKHLQKRFVFMEKSISGGFRLISEE